jgi:hypothetical protein
MTDILIREDTGTHAVVRVIEPDAPVSAPYSRAVGLLERWVAAERHAVDEFAAWIEGQAAQAHAEMRLLCDELGLPFVFAELPVVVEPRRGWTPARRPSDVLAEAYQERADAAEAYMRADSKDAGAAHQARQVPALHPRNTSPGLPAEQLTPVERRSWSAEWAAFRAEVKDMARDMWREFKRMWNVDE